MKRVGIFLQVVWHFCSLGPGNPAAVSGGLAFETDVTDVLNCEELIGNFTCLKARKKICGSL